jgi:hypothetical protein
MHFAGLPLLSRIIGFTLFTNSLPEHGTPFSW